VVDIIPKKLLHGPQMSFRMGSYDGGGKQCRELTRGHSWNKLDPTAGLRPSNQDPIYGFNRKDFDSNNVNPNAAVRYGSRTFVHTARNGPYTDPGALPARRCRTCSTGSIHGACPWASTVPASITRA